MRIGRFLYQDKKVIGVVKDDKWIEGACFSDILGDADEDNIVSYITLSDAQKQCITQRVKSMKDDDPRGHALGDTTYLAPVSEYTNLFTLRGTGTIFSRVIKLKIPTQPTFDMRYAHNFAGHNCTAVLTDDLIEGGWNIEMVAVISKEASHVDIKDAYQYIGGYTVLIDHFSQHKSSPFHKEDMWKMEASEMDVMDYFYKQCNNGNAILPIPIGPVITTSDEISNPNRLSARESENNRMVSVASTEGVLHGFDEVIAYVSRFITLKPGDMISCSSLTYDGYRHWDHYEEGSYVEVEIEKIGKLRMNIIDERGE